MILTFKFHVNPLLSDRLDSILSQVAVDVNKMLIDRKLNSTKHYKELPSVIAKGLINKYQRNKKCKEVRNPVIPINADKGAQCQLKDNFLRVPAIDRKLLICDLSPILPKIVKVNHVEFAKKENMWFVFVCASVEEREEGIAENCLGVDLNSRENIATISYNNRTIERLGFDSGMWKKQFKARKAKMQRRRKWIALKNISKHQSRRSTCENHRVSRIIVNKAKDTNSAIVLEDLSKINSSKCGKYVKKSQWAFFQLNTFIQYKAKLLGIPIIYINPANTSKMCSNCGHINSVIGKKFSCNNCGHEDHRDANAALNIRNRGLMVLANRRGDLSGSLAEPQTGGSLE